MFQALPLKQWDLARLAWIQGFKRSPINFRKLLLVPKEHNSKGVALFLLGYCKLYKLALKGEVVFGSPNEILQKINELTRLLLSLKSEGYSGACWGYNFDWQARRLFLFKKNRLFSIEFVGGLLLALAFNFDFIYAFTFKILY